MNKSKLNKKVYSILRFISRIGIMKSLLICMAMTTADAEAEYELKWKGRKVHIRKGSSDFKVFQQVMVFDHYNYNGLNGSPVETIIDLGANVGLSALYFITKYPNAQVIAVEPEKHNYEQLVKNVMGFSNVYALKNAIWYENKELEIYDGGRGEYAFRIVEANGEKVGTTTCITINDIVKKYNLKRIDILKIDIEGAEKELFMYNYKDWLPMVRCVMIELHDGDHPGCTSAFFRAIAYREFTMFSKGETLIISFDDNKSTVVKYG
jgi:FkbM family methyltransferase